MWSMIGVYNAFLYDGDVDFLENLWANYTFAMAYMQVCSLLDALGSHSLRHAVQGRLKWTCQHHRLA